MRHRIMPLRMFLVLSGMFSGLTGAILLYRGDHQQAQSSLQLGIFLLLVDLVVYRKPVG